MFKIKIEEVIKMLETNIAKKEDLIFEKRDKQKLNTTLYKKNNTTLLIDFYRKNNSQIIFSNKYKASLTEYPIGNFEITINYEDITLQIQFDELNNFKYGNLIIGLEDLFEIYDTIEKMYYKQQMEKSDFLLMINDLNSFIDLFEISKDMSFTLKEKNSLKKITENCKILIESLNS